MTINFRDSFSEDEIAFGEHCFEIQPESPWTAFMELRGLNGVHMSLEREQALFEFLSNLNRGNHG